MLTELAVGRIGCAYRCASLSKLAFHYQTASTARGRGPPLGLPRAKLLCSRRTPNGRASSPSSNQRSPPCDAASHSLVASVFEWRPSDRCPPGLVLARLCPPTVSACNPTFVLWYLPCLKDEGELCVVQPLALARDHVHIPANGQQRAFGFGSLIQCEGRVLARLLLPATSSIAEAGCAQYYCGSDELQRALADPVNAHRATSSHASQRRRGYVLTRGM